MRLENQGLTLWSGTLDAPGPDAIGKPGEELRIRIGVAPADASNRVSVRYRVNGGAEQTAAARWIRNDPSRDVQYFEANLGRFRDGDLVEYMPMCVCAGRRVPSPEMAKKFATSFNVSDDISKPAKTDHSFIAAPRKSLLPIPERASRKEISGEHEHKSTQAASLDINAQLAPALPEVGPPELSGRVADEAAGMPLAVASIQDFEEAFTMSFPLARRHARAEEGACLVGRMAFPVSDQLAR